MLLIGCRRNVLPASEEQKPGGGPEEYSTLVIRTVEQDGTHSTFESRIAVSKQTTREDWAENGEQRALILRPDLGESYLLFLDKNEFVVRPDGRSLLSLDTGSAPNHKQEAGPQLSSSPESGGLVDPVRIETDLSPADLPQTADVDLPDAMIDSHPCKVHQRRVVLSDGTTEVTNTYRAVDLLGMVIRTESESDGKGGHLRIVTDKREIHIGLPQAAFDIPAGFTRRPD